MADYPFRLFSYHIPTLNLSSQVFGLGFILQRHGIEVLDSLSVPLTFSMRAFYAALFSEHCILRTANSLCDWC